MRLVIDVDEKYRNLYYEVAKATRATIIEENAEDPEMLPDAVKAGIAKGMEQVRNGQTQSYEEVKKILDQRWP